MIICSVLATGFLFLMTTLGALMVFLMKPLGAGRFTRIILGFSAGVMLSTSVFALLIPAMNQISGIKGIILITIGFVSGCVVLILSDCLISVKGKKKKNTAGLLMFAMTLHNIPEGITVGLACSTYALNPDNKGLLYAVIVLVIGIGIQNFPETAALGVTFTNNGYSKKQAFIYSMLKPVMPFLLAYAAGTMLHVTVEELIPDVQGDNRKHLGTVGIMSGILLMLVLDMMQGM